MNRGIRAYYINIPKPYYKFMDAEVTDDLCHWCPALRKSHCDAYGEELKKYDHAYDLFGGGWCSGSSVRLDICKQDQQRPKKKGLIVRFMLWLGGPR